MNFSDTYFETKKVFNSISDITDDELAAVEKQALHDNTKNKTNRHLILLSIASLTILISPYIIIKVYNSLDIIVGYLLTQKGHYSKEYIDVTTFSLACGSVAILIYLFLFPDFWLFGKHFPPRAKLFSNINRKQTNYIIISIVWCYIVIGFVLYLIQLNYIQYANNVISILKYYLIIPLSLIVILILMILLVLLSKPLLNHNYKFNHSNNVRIEISFILLNVLDELKFYDKVYLIPQKKIDEVVSNLKYASRLVRYYPIQLNKGVLNHNLTQTFDQSANFIDQVIIDFLTVSHLETLDIKNRLINCLNIVLQGNLLEMPKLEMNDNILISSKKIKLYHYLLFGFYLTLPIIIVISMDFFFKVTFTEYNQSLLKILYIIWAFVGVFSNPIILNTENKELIRDIVKSWFGKG